jgi:hypothetical protein
MSDIRKRVLIAGLGRFVPADYEAGAKLGVQKTNKQMVLDVRCLWSELAYWTDAFPGYREG